MAAEPDFGKLPSINPDFDVGILPDFEDDPPTASNLMKKKKKKIEKTDKKGSSPKPKKNASKRASNASTASNKSNTSSSSTSSKSKSKPSKSPKSSKQKSVKKTGSRKKSKAKPRKSSAIRDRVKQYDEITKRAKEEQRQSQVKKSKKKNTEKGSNKNEKKNKNKDTEKDSKSNDKKKKDDKKTKQNANKSKKEEKTNIKPEELESKKHKTGSISPVASKTDVVDSVASTVDDNADNADNTDNTDNTECKKEEKKEKELEPILLIQESTESQKMLTETRFLESISPIKGLSVDDTTQLFSNDTTDTVKINDDPDSDHSNDDPLYDNNKSAVNELINGPQTESNGPPPAFQMQSMDLPQTPDELLIDTSFEAMYEPSYRHDVVSFPTKPNMPRNNNEDNNNDDNKEDAIELTDGDMDRDIIKQKIAKKEQYKANLKRKQSRTTEFDATKITKRNLWGRKKNTFQTKNGQQAIIEWRFVLNDEKSHTLVLQHEQIKKKKKSKRMVILDGIEKFSDKSKKTEFEIKMKDCSDSLNVIIENKDVNAMKYEYRLKINNVAYSVCFHKWQQSHH